MIKRIVTLAGILLVILVIYYFATRPANAMILPVHVSSLR